MQRLSGVLLVAAATVALSACEPEIDDMQLAEELRTFDSGFKTESRAKESGNGDIQLHVGASTTDPDCLIADIVGDVVFDGPQSVGKVLWELSASENEIYDSYGQRVCTISESEDGRIELRDAIDDQVIASMWGKHVFNGDVSEISPQQRWAHVEYTFNGPHLQEGGRHGPVLTATENIHNADPKRKMVIATFTMGFCGSSGLPISPDLGN